MQDSTREKILETLGSNLLDINIDNGYNLTVKKVVQGIVTLGEVTEGEFPLACFFFDEETDNPLDEGASQFICEVPLIVVIHFEGDNDVEKKGINGKLGEKAVADLTAFFNKSKQVSKSCNFNKGHNIIKWYVNKKSSRFDEVKDSTKFSVGISVLVKYHDTNQ